MRQVALAFIIIVVTVLFVLSIVKSNPVQPTTMSLIIPQELTHTEPSADHLKNSPPAIQIVPELVTLPGKINLAQAKLLKYAHDVAKEDGHNDPTVLQGIIWQESMAGGYPGYKIAGPTGRRYYGIGQIKVAAARDVFKRFKYDFLNFVDKTDTEIISHLIIDNKFNIRVASKYLWMVGHNEQKDPMYVRPTSYAITAYNRGLGNTYDTDYNNWHYTISVHLHKDTFIKTFNLANNIK